MSIGPSKNTPLTSSIKYPESHSVWAHVGPLLVLQSIVPPAAADGIVRRGHHVNHFGPAAELRFGRFIMNWTNK